MKEVSSPTPDLLPNEHTIKSDAASEEDAVFAEGGLAKKTSNTTLDVPIAEERSQDTTDSNFWTTYKKVSDEYDDDFLERANDDMGVILTFGKQWLNSYKAARGRGSLEERCIRRQMKLDGLEQFPSAESLAGIPLRFPQSPFWTPGSKPAGAIGKIFTGSTSSPGPSDKSSAIRWIIETSTNPEYVEAAAAMCTNAYVITSEQCCQKEVLYVKYGKAMAHLCSQPVKIDPILLRKYGWDYWGGRSRFIRDAFMAGRDAYRRMTPEGNASQRANVRTALRTMAVHGLDHILSHPDSEELIWNGDLRWRHSSNGDKPRLEEFDWLVDYLADTAKGDYETEGDTLLALSAMHGLWSSAKQPSFINSLHPLYGQRQAPTNDSMPQGVNAQLLDSLSRALFTAVCPNRQTDHYSASDTPFHEERDGRYINLIFSLAKNGEWRQRLIHDGHLRRCIDLVDNVNERESRVSRTYPSESYLPGFYLPAIIGRINPICKDTTLSATQKKSLGQLVEKTWRTHIYRNDDDYVDAIPALVTATKLIYRQGDVARDRGAWGVGIYSGATSNPCEQWCQLRLRLTLHYLPWRTFTKNCSPAHGL
ncbi:hypothetical protein EDD22DRAFT_845907 [Suillus occidentalis]|nr:hypothetical protein EDD22DRAFT_845907 [Suillus occidentalis]